MKKGTVILVCVLALVLLIGAGVVGCYNNLIEEQSEVEEAFANIESQLQRRADLIPNLVNTVKGYMTHEEEIMKAVSDARAKLAGASGAAELAEADGELSSAVSRLLAVTENYPDLKANQNFIALTDELAGTENRINVARKDYNEEVREYNAEIKKFPSSIFAGMLGFEKAEYFEAAEGSDIVPSVNFD